MADGLRYDKSFLLHVDTPTGVMVREIRAMADVPVGSSTGDAAEDATRTAAAQWGLPDFVYRSTQQATGSGVREVGDTIIVVGHLAAAVQVKAREGPFDNVEKERSWVEKKTKKAHGQATGTIRRLRTLGTQSLVNERDRTVEVDFRGKTWLSVVILDHPGVGDFVPTVASVVLLRSEWEFLFEQLKSTHAVLEYLVRASRSGPVELGREPIRYYEFAAADLATPPEQLPEEYRSLSSTTFSAPSAPQAPAGHDNPNNHRIIRTMLEDIATSPLGEGFSTSDLNEVLSVIDQVAVGYRSSLGETIYDWLSEVAETSEGVLWRIRRILRPGRPQVIFATATTFSEEVRTGFTALVRLRHQQFGEIVPAALDRFTVGVLLTPRFDGFRLWDTSLSATIGAQNFDPEFRSQLEALWPIQA